MAIIKESVEIKLPVDKVFTYTTEAKSWPSWQSFITEGEQTSQGQVGVDTTFKGVNRLMGLSLKWAAKATEFETNRKWGKDITSGSIIVKERLSFDPVEMGTGFTIVYGMNVGGFMKLVSPMVVCSMRKETKKSLANLKRVLEA